ncbi:cytochrome P450 [Ascobolus immersus RN42]|uniref:Cytochrome P450 n=1 Tax=Ascobolus immersus RN42 TaxID=1160509 RepID=A0A3N4IN31_ASCIM|nr:cytochrome P450 [Ascobolus immersus RN42]
MESITSSDLRWWAQEQLSSLRSILDSSHPLVKSALELAEKHWIATVVISWIVYEIGLAIYRLYFHPLAKYPGPKLAAVTAFYEFYYDFYATPKGQTHEKILSLHDLYGDIFRLGPNKLRVNDLQAYDKIHGIGTRFILSDFYKGSQMPKALFTQEDNKVHRERRRILSPLFTKTETNRLLPLVSRKTRMFFDRIERDCQATGKVAWEAHHRMQAILSDIIMEFCYGRSYNLLAQEDQHHAMNEAMNEVVKKYPILKYVPWITGIFKALPFAVNEWLIPGSTMLDQAALTLAKELEVQFKQKEAGTFKKDPNGPVTVYNELLESYDDKEALVQDATMIYAAGVHTVAHLLTVAFYHIAADKTIQDRLFKEIKSVWPDRDGARPAVETLEALPYLTAFIKEARRLSYGISGALPRKTPPGGAELAGQRLPANIVVETSPFSIHHHRAFGTREETRKFRPERWLDPSSRNLEKYIVNFSSGSRICLGIHLAMLEIYHILPEMVRRYEIELGDVMKEEGFRFIDSWMPLAERHDLDFLLTVREE